MPISDRHHDRIRSRLEAFACGLVAPGVADEIREHLAKCDSCRASVESYVPLALPDEAPGAHLPESLVVAWEREAPKLRGLQRELVRRHLDRCDLCREDLRLTGHAAALPVVPELEASEEVLRLLVPVPPPPPREPSWWKRLWRAWPQTSWAVAATAVLAIVAFDPAMVQRLPWNERPAIAPAPPAPTHAVAPAPSASITSRPVIEPREWSRGASMPVPVVTLAPESPVVCLVAGPPDVGLDTDVRVEVREQGGAVRVARTLRARALTHGRILALDLGRDARPGVDTLVVSGERDGRAKTARYLFEVRIEPK